MEHQFHLLTGSYGLNALDDAERQNFEPYALTDAQTLEEMRSRGETAALLAYGVEEERPPPALKADVMAAIRNTRQLPAASVVRDIGSDQNASAETSVRARRGARDTSGSRRSRWVLALGAAAALIVFAGVGVGGWVAGQTATQHEMAEKILTLQKQQSVSQEQRADMLSIVGSADAKIVTTALSDSGSVTGASSITANKAAVMVHNLPILPADKIYELWFISAAGAVPTGIMGHAALADSGMQVLNGPMGGATHVGITVEPAGGSPSPTTTPLMVQAL